MSQDRRLTALEQSLRALKGFRHYTTNDALQARGLYLDCNDPDVGRRTDIATCASGGDDVDGLADDARARLVGQEAIAADERAGWRVLIVCYFDKWSEAEGV